MDENTLCLFVCLFAEIQSIINQRMTTNNQKINKTAYMPPSNQHRTTTNNNHRTKSKNGKYQPQHNNNGMMMIGGNLDGFRIEFHGWKKKCLYVLILCLMTLIVLNLALTLWILNVMEFSKVSLYRVNYRKLFLFLILRR